MFANHGPRLLYNAEIRRGDFFRRFLRLAFLLLVVAGAYLALREAARRGVADALALDIGQLVAIILGGLLAGRGLYNLLLFLIRRNESVRFYDKGFVWERGSKTAKYPWHRLVAYREGARGIYIGRYPVLQWGDNVLRMHDDRVFRFDRRFGDTRPCADAIRRYASYVTGVHLGRALREDRPVRLHRQLTLYRTGVESGRQEIHWSDLDVRREGGRLVIRKRGSNGRFQTVARYPTHRVDNVGGFVDLATETIRTHQPERFRKKGA